MILTQFHLGGAEVIVLLQPDTEILMPQTAAANEGLLGLVSVSNKAAVAGSSLKQPTPMCGKNSLGKGQLQPDPGAKYRTGITWLVIDHLSAEGQCPVGGVC